MTATKLSNWLVQHTPCAIPEVRLFCFPYAGGGPAVFRTWKNFLPSHFAGYALHAPGRESRFSEPCVADFKTLVDNAFKSIQPFAHEPFVLFGHSFGSIVAFETARRLEEQGYNPEMLIVSGRQSPQIPSKRKPISHLPEEDFLSEMAAYNGTPAEVLANQELMELLSPMIRADFLLAENYQFKDNGHLLKCPVMALSSHQDQWLDHDDVQKWSLYTTGEFNSHCFEGDHFYLNQQTEALIEYISNKIHQTIE
jgi:medium-chain acyl-[acyl-carrier-protein] hydrolase